MEKYTKSPLYKVEWSSNGVRETLFINAVSIVDAINETEMLIEVSIEKFTNVIIHSVSEYVEEVEKPLSQDTYEGDILAFKQYLFGE